MKASVAKLKLHSLPRGQQNPVLEPLHLFVLGWLMQMPSGNMGKAEGTARQLSLYTREFPSHPESASLMEKPPTVGFIGLREVDVHFSLCLAADTTSSKRRNKLDEEKHQLSPGCVPVQGRTAPWKVSFVPGLRDSA